MPLRARRRFESLEPRIAPSETLLTLGAAIAASRPDTILIAPPSKPATLRQPWTPAKMEVLLPSVTAPTYNHRAVASLDGLAEIDLKSELDEALGEMLGPDLPPPEPTSPRPAAPLNLGIGTSPSPAPGSGSGGSGGSAGGGGGGGGSPSPSQALTATTDVAHAAAPAPNTSGTVSPMGFGPTAVDDYYQVFHDDVISDNVLTNDSGFGTVYLDSYPTLGTVDMSTGGDFTYQAGYHNSGTDSFTYHFVDDMTGESSNVATVTIDVMEHPPVANPDSYTLQHDMPFHVDALGSTPGVLANDTDPDPQMETMTASLVTAPVNGTLALYSDGSFDYTPKAGEVGTETFTYKNTDALGESSDATVTLNIVDPAVPVAVNDGVDPSGNVIWHTSWRKSVDIQSSFSNNVVVNTGGSGYGNDENDPDGDPYHPVLDSFPIGGDLQLAYDANNNWTGDFIYTPVVGYSGIDTFTYHDNDGAMNSVEATVYTMVQKVDLDLYDGGHPDNSGTYNPGNEVPDSKELSRGAYAVTNANDTNGDGTVDEDQNPVTAVPNKGYNEQDLMKLVINKPNPVVQGLDDVTVTLSPGLDVWTDSVKTAPYPHIGDWTTGETLVGVSIANLPLTVYVEGVAWSSSLRDKSVTATYNNVSDTVLITDISVNVGVCTFDTETQAQLQQKYPDMVTDSTLWDQLQYGSGVLPTIAANNFGTANMSVIQFTVSPPRDFNTQGPWQADGVYFDPTQQLEEGEYYKDAQGNWRPYSPEQWPSLVEFANDDTRRPGDKRHQSSYPTVAGHLYSLDFPGYDYDNAGGYAAYVGLQNFRTFVRVGIDIGPMNGDGWQGSRGSDYVRWHSATSVKDDGQGHLVRDTADTTHNLIGDGDELAIGTPT